MSRMLGYFYFMILLSGLVALSAQPTIAQTALPKQMEGEWYNPNSGHGGDVEVELVRMTSPTEGIVMVEWEPYCSRAETTISLSGGYWEFSGVDCSNNSGSLSLTARVRQVEGKKRMEGAYGEDGSGRTIFLEW